jgi:CRP-like cAMP-binding protein
MTAAPNPLASLRAHDPTAAAQLAEALWAELAREDPKLFAALGRAAARRQGRRRRPLEGDRHAGQRRLLGTATPT